MKTRLLSFVAAVALMGAAAPALAQGGYQALSQRQANLDARIDAGVRTGDLTRAEAQRLRNEFRELLSAESRYRATGGGLDRTERADLDRRFDLLDARIRFDRNDEQGEVENDYDTRQEELTERIDRGLARGDLTRQEATNLRGELRALIRLEAQYERTGAGLDRRERADLESRYDLLQERLRDERRDEDERGGRDEDMSLEERRAALDRRIGNAQRSGQLTALESVRVRAELALLTRTEQSYRTSGGGIDAREEAELQRRYDALFLRFRDERRDDDRYPIR